MSVGTIVQVDPATLTIALNVRTDVKVDKEFVASVKTLGILQPPMVTANADGGYDVVLGQRRTLAAVEAGLKSIPVYVVEQSEADAARVVDQLTENDQRQGLSEAERVAGYKQLSLFGLSPAQIVKKTSRPRKVIDTALSVAGNEVASAALVEHELTLDEAAYLVEFSDDKAAVKKLVDAAGSGLLDHVVAGLREKRELAERVEMLQAELVAEKVIPMALVTSEHAGTAEGDPAGLVRFDKLGKPGAPSEPLEVADVPEKALAGRVVRAWMSGESGYREWAVKQYFVLNPAEHGIPDRDYGHPVRDLTPEEQAEEDARRERLAARAAKQQAEALAAEVRFAWVVELLQRKTLPADALVFVSRWLIAEANVGLMDADAFSLLGITEPEDGDDEEAVLREFVAAAPKVNPVRLLLASVVVDAEREVMRSWGEPWLPAALYFGQLAEWGYGLSDAERAQMVAPVEEDAA